MFKQLLACVEIVLPGKARCVQTTIHCGLKHGHSLQGQEERKRFGMSHFSATETEQDSFHFLSLLRNARKLRYPHPLFVLFVVTSVPFLVHSGSLHWCKSAHHVDTFLFILDLGEVEEAWPHLASQPIRNPLVHTSLQLKWIRNSNVYYLLKRKWIFWREKQQTTQNKQSNFVWISCAHFFV